MRKVFKDNILDKQFYEQGYVIVDLKDKILSKNILKKVKSLKSGVDAPFYTSLWSSDSNYRNTVNQIILENLAPIAEYLLYDYTPLFGDLLVKRPSWNKDFPVHQDWTFVDETQYASVYVWCPLVDVHPRNGNLQVVSGSHHFLDKIRGANITVSYETIKPEIQKKYTLDIPLKAGQAIIFNQALLHASPPNRSLSTRIAIGLLMLPKEAKIYHYMQDPNSSDIKKFHVDKDFFLKYSENINFKDALSQNNFTFTSTYLQENITIDRHTLNIKDFEEYIRKTNK